MGHFSAIDEGMSPFKIMQFERHQALCSALNREADHEQGAAFLTVIAVCIGVIAVVSAVQGTGRGY